MNKITDFKVLKAARGFPVLFSSISETRLVRVAATSTVGEGRGSGKERREVTLLVR